MKPLITSIDSLLRRRFFIAPSAFIYNTISGLFDYGPLGISLKNNITTLWRSTFIKPNIYELDCSIITPYEVLKASGHVDKFTDMLVFDLITNDCYRADHLLQTELSKHLPNTEVSSILQNIDSLMVEEVDDVILKYNIKSNVGNKLGKCVKFNLIFNTSVGAKGRCVAFLRPETAQGQFVNFKKLYEINGEKLPFGSFCIGKVFRNEISPRGGLIRVREFEQAEIEYYVNPNEKDTKLFYELPEINLNVHYLIHEEQETVKMLLTDAVNRKIIDNQTIGYFIGKTYLFLMEIGIRPDILRFRQHRKDEMAHYASDCWDAEILTSYGWIECVGIADRGCYDLTMHHNASGTNMKAQKMLNTAIIEHKWELFPDKKNLGQRLKHELQEFIEIMDNISQEYIINNLIAEDDKFYIRIPFHKVDCKVEVRKVENKIFVEEYFPCVIEPSFGIGRILYALVESCFYQREDDGNRCVLGFNPKVAPIKCVISTLLNKDTNSKSIVDTIVRDLEGDNIEYRVCDRSISIGRKYVTYDEMGVPFFITVDVESIKDNKVTIRERDSMKQIRVAVNDVSTIIKKFVRGKGDLSIFK